MADTDINTPHQRIAIVTGGSRGLGRSTVLSLAGRGVVAIFTYHSNRAEAEKVVGLAAEAGAKAIALQLDTGDVGGFDGFVEKVRGALRELGAERFDYLVNNAGTSHHNGIETTTEAELDGLYNVHFKGVFFLTQELLPLIRDNPEINRMVAQNTALGRAGLPDDIGPMIASLLSDDNRWVNGQRIEVSGGMAL